jgi:adenylate kinase
MLKEKKLEFQQTLEEYLEQQKLYEVFESLMKSLITERPEDPIEHLIKKLEQPESKPGKRSCNGFSAENFAD